MHCRSFLSLVFISLLAATASGRDIFVNNVSGDDRRGGRSPVSEGEAGGPCKTIAKALRIADPGDRIIVANTGTPYRESITLQAARHSGTDRYPFTLVGNGAILDGTASLAGAEWEHVGGNVFRTLPRLMSYQKLFLNDQPATERKQQPGQPIALAALEWCSVEGWIYFRVEDNKLPQSYSLSCCGQTVGITLYDVHDCVVQDLMIRGFQLDGINAHDTVTRTDLVGLSCHDNGRSGISIGGASRVRVEACSSAGNGEAQLRTEGYCIVELIGNMLDATSAPAVIREGGRIIEPEAASPQ